MNDLISGHFEIETNLEEFEDPKFKWLEDEFSGNFICINQHNEPVGQLVRISSKDGSKPSIFVWSQAGDEPVVLLGKKSMEIILAKQKSLDELAKAEFELEEVGRQMKNFKKSFGEK